MTDEITIVVAVLRLAAWDGMGWMGWSFERELGSLAGKFLSFRVKSSQVRSGIFRIYCGLCVVSLLGL
jgi:hypothetical protein